MRTRHFFRLNRSPAELILFSLPLWYRPDHDAVAKRTLVWWILRTPTTVGDRVDPKKACCRAGATARFPQVSCCISGRCGRTLPRVQERTRGPEKEPLRPARAKGSPRWRSSQHPTPVNALCRTARTPSVGDSSRSRAQREAFPPGVHLRPVCLVGKDGEIA